MPHSRKLISSICLVEYNNMLILAQNMLILLRNTLILLPVALFSTRNLYTKTILNIVFFNIWAIIEVS